MAADFVVDGEFKLVGDSNAQAQINRVIRFGVEAAKSGNQEIAEQVEQALARKFGQTYTAKGRIQVQYDSNTGELVVEQKKILPILEKAGALIKKNTQNQEGSLTKLRGQQREAAQLRDSIAKIDPITGKINEKWTEANNKLSNINVQIAGIQGNLLGLAKAKFPVISQIFSLGNALGQAGFIINTVVEGFRVLNQAVAPVIARAKQLEGLELALKGFGATSREAAEVLDSAKRVSLQYGASLTSVEKAYKRLAPAIVQNGGSFAETEEIIASLTARTTTLGLNTEQTGRYIEAFAQVMGKGKLQSEELTQQFSELDGALRGQLAAYFKAEQGIDDLEEAMKNGEIRASDFRYAFVAVSREMKENLAGAIGEVQQRLSPFNEKTRLTIQQMQNLQSTFDTITVESLAKTFEEFGRAMARVGVTFSQFFASLANDLPGLQRLVSDIFTAIGFIIEGGIGVILVTIKAVVFAVDLVVRGFYAMIDALKLLPGATQYLGNLNGFIKFLDTTLRGAGNAFLSLGEASVVAKAKFADYAANASKLTQQFIEGKISASDYREKIQGLKDEAATKKDPEGIKVIDEAVRKTKENLGGIREKLNTELQGLDELAEKLKQVYDEEKQKIQDSIDLTKEKIAAEKEQYDDLKDKIKERYDGEIDKVKEVLDLTKERYQQELDRLDALTPAEERLQELRRQELQDKAANASLTEKERVEAQASLDAMDRRLEKQEIQNSKKEEERELTEQINDLENAREDQLKQAAQDYQSKIAPLEQQVEIQKEAIKNLDQEFDNLNQRMETIKTQYDNSKQTMQELTGRFNDQIEAVKNAGAEYDSASNAISTLDGNLQSATTAASNLNAELSNLATITGGGESRFSGGSVKGGKTYTVNEFGTESFLSSSGRLSLINKKSWSQWTAPSSGTVIPAHITSQLDIPANGVNLKSLNRAAVERNPISTSVSGSVTYGSSDNVTNNITIQSQSPVQDASKLMIDVIKRRNRRRF